MFLYQNKVLILKMMKIFTSLPISHLMLLMLLNTSMVKAKPKAKGNYIVIKKCLHTNNIGSPDPGPWDWQNEQHEPSNYPVFNPYPVSKPEQPEFMKINRNIAAVVGETAFLPCRVKNLDEHTVGTDNMAAMYPSCRRYPGSEQMM